MSNDFSRQANDKALRAELDGKIILDIPIEDFVEAAFPKAYRGEQQSPLYNRRGGYLEFVKQYLQIAETATEKSQTYESFISIVNYVVRARYAPIQMVGRRSVKGADRR